MASQDWFEKDFYAILGVPHDADAAQIKKAYRKLARQWHPDSKPGDAAAEQRFKGIGEAYAVLSDPEERQQYDAIRQMASGGARFTAAGGPGGATGGAGFDDVFSQMFGGGGAQNVRFSTGGGGGGAQGGINLEDLLGGLGGAGGPGGFGQEYGGFRSPRGPQKGRDLQARAALSFRQAVEGSTVTLTGPDGARVTARIPAGVKDGQRIRLRGQGAEGDPGTPKGDMILTVAVGSHPAFGRDGTNLTVELPVTFSEAALGATVQVPTLDGSSVKVKVAPGTPAGRVLRLKGRGIRTKDGTGDLLAKVTIAVPQRLSDRAREALEVLASQEDGADPRAELFALARE